MISNLIPFKKKKDYGEVIFNFTRNKTVLQEVCIAPFCHRRYRTKLYKWHLGLPLFSKPLTIYRPFCQPVIVSIKVVIEAWLNSRRLPYLTPFQFQRQIF